jgi:hypothetical protein
MNKRVLRLGLIPLLLWVATACAEDARTVAWDDLSVRLTAAENPFLKLTTDQLLALSDVAGLRTRKSRGIVLTAEEAAIEKSALARLRKDGVDVDDLLARRDAIAEKKRGASAAVNASLDGKLIRIAGYVLPLEFSGTKVTEFLLVPWVGACIHTPPPEANQIVYVKADKAFDIRRDFDAVWVTGRLATSGAKQSVYIVDGTADIDVGYALRASTVELYSQ